MATVGSSDSALSPGGDLHCEPCFSDGRTRNVEGFCVECTEYLCQSCLDAHRILRVSKTHHIKRGADIPKTNSSNQVEQGCHLHIHQKISSFCKSHQQLCCDQCVILAHKCCTDVISIGDYSEDFVDCHFKTVTVKEKIKLLQSVYTAKTEEAKRNLDELDSFYHKAMDTFKAEVDKLKIADQNKLKAIVSTYESVLSHLTVYNQEIERFTKTKESKALFVEMLKTEAELRTIEGNVLKLCTDDSIVRYGFTPDKASLLRLVNAPFLIRSFNIKDERDENTCQIADIAILRENFLLITDKINSSMKIFNSESDTLVSYVKLRYQPWQITVTEQGEAYVALEGQFKVLHLTSPGTDLATFRELSIDGKCYAVECFNKTLKIPCLSPAKLIEVDGDGKLVRVINNDLSKFTTKYGEQFVSNPCWSTKDPVTGSMYVSCNQKNSITEIRQDDTVKLFMKSDKLNGPYGMCMDTDGSIIVCSFKSNAVFRVMKNGDIQSVFPNPLEFTTRAVALDKQKRLLYVAGNSDKISVFQI
ncbi:uncharacterized protein LOC128216342 [Mya arenaria]|uniref:uncharacterized protein LOC128216342 n=1 Tax=Mya arenaria TaxID=6604 RepID=UPI0022E35131|nr:uncharacterized protein LOC128216342 [Mya arenaria]